MARARVGGLTDLFLLVVVKGLGSRACGKDGAGRAGRAASH